MTANYEHIFQPIKVGNIWLKNRIMCAPTGLCSDSNGLHTPGEGLCAHLENHAKNEAGLIVMTGGNLFPIPKEDRSWVIDLYQPGSLNALGNLAERIHRYGAKISMELHQGAVDLKGYGVCSGIRLPNGKIAREMPEEYMPELVRAYGDAAWNLKEVGFDGILLQFGHGWTISQFLSPLTNHRTDAYGGNTENRTRLPRRILEGIRKRVGNDFLIDLRLSVSECEPGGIDPEEAVRIIENLQDLIDMVNASCGLHNTKWFTTTHPTGFLPPMANAYLAGLLKDSGRVRVPVAALGGITDIAAADRLIGENKADLICVARAFIADTEFAKKAREGRAEEIRPCIKCLRCHDSAVFEHQFRCSVNPIIGMEHIMNEHPEKTREPKKVIVIGGGPAGMQAALTAAEMGHQVTLYEKEQALGGEIVFAKLVGFKYGINDYLNYQIRQLEKNGVRIMTGVRVNAESLEKEDCDILIPAIGAEPYYPPIPGAKKAVSAVDVFDHEKDLPEDVIIVGAGQTGCETALHLASLGKRIRLFGRAGELAPDASQMHRGDLLNKLTEDPRIICFTGAEVTAVKEREIFYRRIPGKWQRIETEKDIYGENAQGGALWAGVIAQDSITMKVQGKNEEDSACAEAVVLAAGMRPREKELLLLMKSAKRVIPAGSCIKNGTIEGAVHSGYYAALQI